MKWHVVGIVLGLIAVYVLSFFLTSGLLWLVCWALKWTWWSWRVCFGIWLLLCLLESTFKVQVSK